MNKLFLFAFVFTALLFASCNSFTEHDVTIENRSSETVHFTVQNYPDIEKQTLSSGASVTLDLYDHPRLTFNAYERVYYETGSSSVEIKDLDKHEYRIINNSTNNADSTDIIEANNMLGKSASEAVVTVSYKSDDTTTNEATVYVYTENPTFKKRYVDSSDSTNSDGTTKYKYADVPSFISISKIN